MTSIQALRERLAALNKKMNALLAEKGSQTWSADDQKVFDVDSDEAERVQRQISATQKMLDQEAQESFRDVKPGNQADNTPKQKAKSAFELYLRKSARDFSAEEALTVRNTMSTSTGNQGGYTVPVLISPDYIEALKDYGGMRRVAGQVTTAAGNDMSFPTTDGTAEIGEIVAQNSPASSQDVSFGTVPLNVVKFGSKVITIPIELLQDTAIDIVGLINKRLRDRIGRIQNLKFTQGSGVGEPTGLVTAAQVGKIGASGQTLTVVYDDLVDMVDSVDIAYLAEGDMTWQFNQTLRRSLRKIKDTVGRPIWTPGYESGITKDIPDLLMGYPVNINNDLPTPAANAKSLTFGQHKKYMIRDAMEVTIFRFDDSPYMSRGQVGFLAWCRAGGNLLDTSAVRVYQHSAT